MQKSTPITIPTRWASWLKSICYHVENFEEIENYIERLILFDTIRSFSALTNLLTDKRTCFKEENLEELLVIQGNNPSWHYHSSKWCNPMYFLDNFNRSRFPPDFARKSSSVPDSRPISLIITPDFECSKYYNGSMLDGVTISELMLTFYIVNDMSLFSEGLDLIWYSLF